MMVERAQHSRWGHPRLPQKELAREMTRGDDWARPEGGPMGGMAKVSIEDAGPEGRGCKSCDSVVHSAATDGNSDEGGPGVG